MLILIKSDHLETSAIPTNTNNELLLDAMLYLQKLIMVGMRLG
jgi:hypothetical protein